MKKFLLLFISVVFMSLNSSALSFTYTPATVTSITSSTEIVLTFSGVYGTYFYRTSATQESFTYSGAVKNAAGETLSGNGVLTWGPSYTQNNQLTWMYDGNDITATGAYTITIPAGAINIEDVECAEYTPSKEMTFTLTIGSTQGGTGTGGENTPSSIGKINNEQLTVNSCDMFNLAGQRVNSSAHGIVIKNGKKIINK